MAEARAVSLPSLETEEFMVPTSNPRMRNKHPAGVTAYASNRILLFVHGATYPADTSFDLELNGVSWMDYNR